MSEKAEAPATWREPGVGPGQFASHYIGSSAPDSSRYGLGWAPVTAAPPPPPGPWVERWLSAGRFSTYLTAAGGDRSRALDLYEWSACMSAAIMHDLAHLEVAIRNAYSGALEARQGGRPHWTEDLGRYFPYRRGTAANRTAMIATRSPAVRSPTPSAPPAASQRHGARSLPS